ncbi:MAG: TolC family protein [Candidatus Eisenbacteria bacterium]|uniref:TolC family protein n=1 Tax=Eiseniibacteriota bacterium TaxID=2212470 RepID=A0A538U1G3_UNCEI|nr:MAG: TolC family protein [Candidatus Eisenbacteria bacterium]
MSPGRSCRAGAALALAFALLAARSFAAPAPPLSFGQAVQTAARAATSVEVANERLREARARVGEARGPLLPALSGTAAATERTFNLKSFGIDFPTPPGASLSDLQGPVDLVDARVRVTQNVLAPADLVRVRAASHDVRAASFDRDAAGEAAAQDAAMAYLRATRAQALAAARAADARLAEELVSLAQAQLQAGTAPAIDTTRARTELASTRGALVMARNQAERARIDLARALGLDPSSPPALTDTLSESLGQSEAPTDPGAAASMAIAHRPEIAAEESRLRRTRSERTALAVERLPRVQAEADWGVSGQHWAASFPTYEFGLALSMPLFDGWRRESQIAEKSAGVRESELREKDLRDRAVADVRGTLLDLASGRELLQVADERLGLAEEEMSQTRERFTNGLAGSIEIVTAQSSLVRARDAAIDARFAIASARVALARAAGVARTLR